MILQQIRHSILCGGEKPAFRCAEGGISYQELGRAAECFRERAARSGSGPILLWGKKQLYFPAAMLGCAFAGACYLPVDSGTPVLRLQRLLQDARPREIWAFDPFPCSAECPVIYAEELLSRLSESTALLPEPMSAQDTPLYRIYTSGSSGVPKGVVITRENLNCFARWMQSLCVPTPDVVLNQASFSFDLSVADFYQAFSTGACLTALESELQRDFIPLFAALRQSDAQLMVCTPSFASMLLADRSFAQSMMKRLSTIFFCGEVLPVSVVRALWERFPGIRILNAYGPTECTVAAAALEVRPEHAAAGALPVGFARPGTSIMICAERNGETSIPLPDGTEGEIAICGQGVSPGYANLHSDAFCTINGLPAYFTGDRGYLQDGMLYFCGRSDRQVKLRGYRIELDDVEQNLLSLPEVAQAAVIAVQDSSAAVKRLKAFAVLQKGCICSAGELRKKLAERLAPYMLPSILLLEQMPLNQNGKIDRGALRELRSSTMTTEEKP